MKVLLALHRVRRLLYFTRHTFPGIDSITEGETHRKTVVAIAVECAEGRIGLIRPGRVADVIQASLVPLQVSAVALGSTVHTDGRSGYGSLPKHAYAREITMIRRDLEPGHVSMPHVHLVVSLLKRWLPGAFQGAVSPRHLDYDVDGFTLRYNLRTSRHLGILFDRFREKGSHWIPFPPTPSISMPAEAQQIPARPRYHKDSSKGFHG